MDESEQDYEQIWTLLSSRLRSTTDISDSPPEDGIIMIEVAHNIEPSTTLSTSSDGIELPISHKPSDTQDKDSTLPTYLFLFT